MEYSNESCNEPLKTEKAGQHGKKKKAFTV